MKNLWLVGKKLYQGQMSPVRTANGIPAGFSLGFIVAQFGALETVVGDFLGHYQIFLRLKTNPGITSSQLTLSGDSSISGSCPGR
jgi:hypothetical protein